MIHTPLCRNNCVFPFNCWFLSLSTDSSLRRAAPLLCELYFLLKRLWFWSRNEPNFGITQVCPQGSTVWANIKKKWIENRSNETGSVICTKLEQFNRGAADDHDDDVERLRKHCNPDKYLNGSERVSLQDSPLPWNRVLSYFSLLTPSWMTRLWNLF